MDWLIQPCAPSLAPDGQTPIYAARGTFTYGMKDAVRPGIDTL